MHDQQLDILIRTIADQHGAEEVASSLKRVNAATQEGGKASVKAGELGSEAAKEHTGHIEGLHRAVGFLGRQFGEMGHLAHFALSLPSLAIAALAIGIHKVVEHVSEWKKKIEETALEMQKLDQAKLDGVRGAMEAGKIATSNLIREMEHAGREVDTLKERFAKLKAAYEAAGIGPESEKKELAERVSQQEAKEMRVLAAVHAAQALDQDPQYLLSKKSLEIESGKTEGLRTAVRQELQSNILRNAGLSGKSPEELDSFASKRSSELGISRATFMTGEIGGAIQRVLDLAKPLEENARTIASATAVLTAHDIAKGGAEAQVAAAKADFDANANRIEEIQRGQGVARSAGRGAAASLDLSVAERLSGRASRGENLTVAEQSIVRQVGSVATGKSVDFETAVRALEFEKANRETHTKFLERLIRVIENDHGSTRGFERRISNLEGIVAGHPN